MNNFIFKFFVIIQFFIASALLFATDPIHDNCVGTITNQSVYAADYANYTMCTNRMDADTRTVTWGVGNGTKPTIGYSQALYLDIDNVTVLLNSSINEAATFNGSTFDPSLAADDNEPAFAAIAPNIADADDRVYYETLITKYPEVIGNATYYDQYRLVSRGLVLSTDVASNASTRALMVPLRTVSEYSSFQDAMDIATGPVSYTGNANLTEQIGLVRCQRAEEDIPFGPCITALTLEDFVQTYKAQFVNVDYCTYIPVWRLSDSNYQQVVPGYVEFSAKIALEDNGIAQQSYAFELLLLENETLDNGSISTERKPCTRKVDIFPSFHNPDIVPYYRTVYTDHSLVSKVFLTEFPTMDHLTYDWVEAVNNEESTAMYVFSINGQKSNDLNKVSNEDNAWNWYTKMRTTGWALVNEPRIRILGEDCCSGGGDLRSEPIFAKQSIGGSDQVINRIVALRNETEPDNVTLTYKTFHDQWCDNNACTGTAVTPRSGLTDGYDWLVGGSFNTGTGRVDVPDKLHSNSLYEKTSFKDNRYYRLYANRSNRNDKYTWLTVDSGYAQSNYIVNQFKVTGEDYNRAIVNCGFGFTPHGTAWFNLTKTNVSRRCYVHPNRWMDRPYLGKDNHPLIPAWTDDDGTQPYIRPVPGEHGSNSDEVIYYTGANLNINDNKWGPQRVEAQAMIGSYFFVFPVPSPDQYVATDEFYEALHHLNGTEIATNRLITNVFNAECKAVSCTYTFNKIIP